MAKRWVHLCHVLMNQSCSDSDGGCRSLVSVLDVKSGIHALEADCHTKMLHVVKNKGLSQMVCCTGMLICTQIFTSTWTTKVTTNTVMQRHMSLIWRRFVLLLIIPVYSQYYLKTISESSIVCHSISVLQTVFYGTTDYSQVYGYVLRDGGGGVKVFEYSHVCRM